MKIYAVYARVELTEKPDWLEDFRRKYHNAYVHHITLKQAAHIEEAQLPDLQQLTKQTLSSYSVPNHTIQLVFDKIDSYREDGSILILAQHSQELANLQKKIQSDLAAYSDYIQPELRQYEENFQPHLTIAFDLGDRFDQAIADLGQEVRIVGEISEIVLSCVNSINPDEAKNPANQTIYHL